MVACLVTSPRLKTFLIGFRSATPRPDRIRLPLITRAVLPSLTHIEFSCASEYLEELVSQIDGPQLNQIHITYLNQLVDFQVAQLFRFIDRSEDPELTLLRHADVTFTDRLVSLDLYQRPPRHPNLVPVRISILCQGIDWQVSHIAQVLSHRSTFLSHVIDLKLEFGADEDCQLKSVDNVEWLHLLRQFSVVQTLRVCRELAGHVALALEDVTEEMAAEVLPALESIDLVGQLASSVDKFVDVRRLSGRPTIVVGVEMRRVIRKAEAIYRTFFSYKDAFPTLEQKLRWGKAVWPRACLATGIDIAPPANLAEVLADVGSHFLADMKKKITPLVERFYGFDTSKAQESLNDNTANVQNLKTNSAFINDDRDELPYRHPAIQKAVNVIWFNDRSSDGIVFQSSFNPMPYEAIALVLAVIECCIDEWSKGSWAEIPFTYEDYKEVYSRHLEALKGLTSQGLSSRHCDPLHKFRQDIYNEGRKYAGLASRNTKNEGLYWPQESVNAACDAALIASSD
ncbi:hypothetical protein EDB85DRAFT_2034004 [Lactarius pseudohatsudake]|nr:hypothetical protein EDB85DRAFT_2034004 [Lactarius pseudohatsudake]